VPLTVESTCRLSCHVLTFDYADVFIRQPPATHFPAFPAFPLLYTHHHPHTQPYSIARSIVSFHCVDQKKKEGKKNDSRHKEKLWKSAAAFPPQARTLRQWKMWGKIGEEGGGGGGDSRTKASQFNLFCHFCCLTTNPCCCCH